MKVILLWFLSLFSRAKKLQLMEHRGHPYRDPPWALESVPIVPEPKPVKKKWNFKMSWKYDLPDTLFGMLGFGVLFGAFSLIAYSLFGAIVTPKTIDYCYVQHFEVKEKATDREADKAKMDAEGNVLRQKYVLKGHVNWDNDRNLAGSDNLPDVLKAAEALQCQVK